MQYNSHVPDIFDAKNLNHRSYEPQVSQETPEPVEFVEQEEAGEPGHQHVAQPEKPRRKRHVDDYSETIRQEIPSSNPFNSFSAKPINVGFSTQHRDEQVILLLRQHPITQLKWILVAIGLVFVPWLFSAMPVAQVLPMRFQTLALVGWMLLIVGFSLEAFLSWFYNVYIVTDERVIDVDFHSLIFKNISSAKIDNIEDVTERTGGAIRALFDFGTVKIQTAAAQVEFEFDNVPHPSKVTSLLNELILEEEREKVEGRVQ